MALIYDTLCLMFLGMSINAITLFQKLIVNIQGGLRKRDLGMKSSVTMKIKRVAM